MKMRRTKRKGGIGTIKKDGGMFEFENSRFGKGQRTAGTTGEVRREETGIGNTII